MRSTAVRSIERSARHKPAHTTADLGLEILDENLHAAAEPRWLRGVEAVHASAPSPLAVAADAVALAVTAVALRVPPSGVAILAVVIPLVLYMGHHYVPRSTLETQGVTWYASKVVAGYAVATVALLTVLGLAERVRVVSPQLGGAPGARAALLGAAGFGALLAVRVATWAVLSSARRHGHGLRNAAVLGSGDQAARIVAKLRAYPEAGLRPTMILKPRWEDPEAAWDPEEAAVALWSGGVRHLVVIPDGNPERELRQYLDHVDGLFVSMLPPLTELFLAPGRQVSHVGGLPLLPLGRWSPPFTKPGKRAFDLLVAGTLLLLLSPVLAAAAVAIKLTSPGPVIYRQRRVGSLGQTFEMWKLRTMSAGADNLVIDLADRNSADGLLFKVKDDPRVTPVGRILRRLSIDELPQLVNVLRGQMSLVGPRPLAVSPDNFGEGDHWRHMVLPGITGYWQVSGGNGLTYQEMIKLDVAYIQGWSLWLDIVLLAKTVPAVLRRRGPW